jgi:hypothetical protein
MDDFFNSLPTKVYYWRINDSGYRYGSLTSFNAAVLKYSGVADKYLFQESDILVIEKERRGIIKYFYHYHYFPDENERDMKVKIFLPDSQVVYYIDSMYPHIAKEDDLDAIELKIDKYSNVLVEYNTLYLEELDYSPGSNMLLISVGLGLTAGSFLWASTTDEELIKGITIGYGTLSVVAVIVNGVRTIRDSSKVNPRRAKLKKLESTLKDIINTN